MPDLCRDLLDWAALDRLSLRLTNPLPLIIPHIMMRAWTTLAVSSVLSLNNLNPSPLLVDSH